MYLSAKQSKGDKMDISTWDLNPAFDSVTADAPVSTDVALCVDCAFAAEGGDALDWDAVDLNDDWDVTGLACDACGNAAKYSASAHSY
jgi:hypothetical protein